MSHAQYCLYVQATDATPPAYWDDAEPPKDKLDHPVVDVSWYDTCAYCEWLSQVTGKQICLPSEAQWEKAARGDRDNWVYPWGNTFDAVKCNNEELDLEETTPVGVFLTGASPYGCLDMVGNVWEWTRSLWGTDLGKPDFPYPYDLQDGREHVHASEEIARVLRGGSFRSSQGDARCAVRHGLCPQMRRSRFGFRVAVLL